MPVKLVQLARFEDERGWFSETYNRDRLAAAGIEDVFCQDNHSMSRQRGVLRGLHFQRPPHAQAKLVRCVRGAIWDVAVDIRAGSPTFGKWNSYHLSAEVAALLYVPVGFAHGFVTLVPETEVEYKVSDFYAPECEVGIIWSDPELAIPWPLPDGDPVVSAKDAVFPALADLKSPFEFRGEPLTLLDPLPGV